MTTVADNIRSMAALVAEVKKAHHLTETTVLRIVDMNFALAQSGNQPPLDTPDGEFMPEGFPYPSVVYEGDAEPAEEGEDETLATIEPKEPLN